MNHRTFLELLNLYVDGEIHSADAVELEKEILANPKRRRIYDDYCRIHRATKLMYDRFREAAVSPSAENVPSLPRPTRRQRRTPARSKHTIWTVWIGGAVAAGAAVVLIAVHADKFHLSEPAVAAQVPEAAVTNAAESETLVAAPFAPVPRSDPYVAETPNSQPNPFTLTPGTASETAATVDQMSATSEPKLSSPFDIPTPAWDPAWFSTGDNPTQDVRRSRVFRSPEASETVELEPVGYLIHR